MLIPLGPEQPLAIDIRIPSQRISPEIEAWALESFFAVNDWTWQRVIHHSRGAQADRDGAPYDVDGSLGAVASLTVDLDTVSDKLAWARGPLRGLQGARLVLETIDFELDGDAARDEVEEVLGSLAQAYPLDELPAMRGTIDASAIDRNLRTHHDDVSRLCLASSLEVVTARTDIDDRTLVSSVGEPAMVQTFLQGNLATLEEVAPDAVRYQPRRVLGVWSIE